MDDDLGRNGLEIVVDHVNFVGCRNPDQRSRVVELGDPTAAAPVDAADTVDAAAAGVQWKRVDAAVAGDDDQLVQRRDRYVAARLPEQWRVEYAKRRDIAAGKRRKHADGLAPVVGNIKQAFARLVADIGRAIQLGRGTGDLTDGRGRSLRTG